MSADPEVLHPVYERWSRGDFSPPGEVYTADLEWGWSDEFPDIAGMSQGVEGRDERLIAWLSSWDHWQVEAEKYLVSGDMVVVMCRYTGRGTGSGVDIDTEGAHLWTLSGGRATRLVIFSDRERALEAAGLGSGGASV